MKKCFLILCALLAMAETGWGQALNQLPERTARIDTFDWLIGTRDSAGVNITYKYRVTALNDTVVSDVVTTVVDSVYTIIASNNLTVVNALHGQTIMGSPNEFVRVHDTIYTSVIVLPQHPVNQELIGVMTVQASTGLYTVVQPYSTTQHFNKPNGPQSDTILQIFQPVWYEFTTSDSTWTTVVNKVPYFKDTILGAGSNPVLVTGSKLYSTLDSVAALLFNTDSVGSTYSSVTFNLNLYGGATITGLASGLTINNPTDANTSKKHYFNMAIYTASAQTLSWGTKWVGGSTNTLPTTTVATKTLIMDFEYLTIDNNYHLVGLDQE